MRLASLFVAAALVLQVAACSSSSTGTGTGTSGGSGGGGASGASGASGGGGAGSCESACGYYLQCKAADTADNRALCNQRCVAQGYTSQQLSDFQRMDCPHAVAAIDGSSSSSSSGSSSGSSCTGCVWDGSSCIYLTGSGGNYFACDRSCCP